MLCPLTRRNRYLGSVPFAPHLPEFTAPLATSTSESGLPGVTTPGTFHPSVFATVRRFTPPISCLFYFTQAPPMGFKEQADLLSLKTDGPEEPYRLRARVSRLGQDRIPAGRTSRLAAFLVLPSLDAPHVSGNDHLGKPRHPLLPTKRRLPEDPVRQQKTSNRLTQTAVPRIDSL